MARDGQFSPTDLVQMEGGQWQPAKDIKGFIPRDEPSVDPTSGVAAGTKLGKTLKSWLALLDLRFEHYLTPRIVRFFWIAFLLIAFILFAFNTLALIWGMLPDLASTPAQPQWAQSIMYRAGLLVQVRMGLPRLCFMSGPLSESLLVS